MNAPLPHNESARLEVLYACGVLDTPAEASFDKLAAQVAWALQAPIAVIGFIDEQRHWFKAKFGTDITVNKREWATCAHTIYLGSTLACPDVSQEPRFNDMPPLSQAGIRAYAGTPIFVNGCAIGTVCVFDQVVRPFTPLQLAALEEHARKLAEIFQTRLEDGANYLPNEQALLGRVRQTPPPSTNASVRFVAPRKLHLEHGFEAPSDTHWQLWGMNPTDRAPRKLEAFVGSVCEFVPPLDIQMLLLSLEPNTHAVQPTQVMAVLPVRIDLSRQN